LESQGLDFSKLFVRQKELPGQKIYHSEKQDIIWKPCSTAA